MFDCESRAHRYMTSRVIHRERPAKDQGKSGETAQHILIAGKMYRESPAQVQYICLGKSGADFL